MKKTKIGIYVNRTEHDEETHLSFPDFALYLQSRYDQPTGIRPEAVAKHLGISELRVHPVIMGGTSPISAPSNGLVIYPTGSAISGDYSISAASDGKTGYFRLESEAREKRHPVDKLADAYLKGVRKVFLNIPPTSEIVEAILSNGFTHVVIGANYASKHSIALFRRDGEIPSSEFRVTLPGLTVRSAPSPNAHPSGKYPVGHSLPIGKVITLSSHEYREGNFVFRELINGAVSEGYVAVSISGNQTVSEVNDEQH